MIVFAVELFRFGQPRSSHEVKAAEPLIADLRFDPKVVRVSAQVATLCGQMVGYNNPWLDLVAPLMRPHLAAVGRDSFTLVGTQRSHKSGHMVEYLQAWWIRPGQDAEKTTDPHGAHAELERNYSVKPRYQQAESAR